MKRLTLALAVAALTLAAAASAAAPQAQRQQLLVGFAQAPGASEHALVRSLGGTVRFSFPSIGVLAVDLGSDRVDALVRGPGVRYVEEDAIRTPLGLSTAELSPSLSNGLYGLLTTKANDAQTAGYVGSGVKACVADTGLDTTHPDIGANFVAGHDSFGGTSTVDVFALGVADTETHATHVSGIVLGVKGNSTGIYGVAPSAKLYEARVLGTQADGSVSGTTSQIMDGVRWLAAQGCKVINMSLGGGARNRSEESLYKQVTSNGTLIVAASGNDGATRISYPAAYDSVLAVGAVDRNNVLASFSNTGRGLDLVGPGVDNLSSVPKDHGSDASVGAGGATYAALGLEFAGKTSGVTGPLVDCGLAASAGDCGQQSPGFVALIQRGTVSFADKVTNATAAGAAAAIIYNNAAGNFTGTLGSAGTWIPAVSVSDTDGAALKAQLGGSATVANLASSWDVYSGTSMATPHVSGVAALLYGKNPTLTVSKITQILESTATDLGKAGYDTTYGYGIVNATAALAATP